jgi:hypothetical protein
VQFSATVNVTEAVPPSTAPVIALCHVIRSFPLLLQFEPPVEVPVLVPVDVPVEVLVEVPVVVDVLPPVDDPPEVLDEPPVVEPLSHSTQKTFCLSPPGVISLVCFA